MGSGADEQPLRRCGQQWMATEFLLCWVGQQEYGIELDLVREVRGYDGIRDLPHLPPHFPGAIELDEGLLPLLDLRIRLNGEPVLYDQFTAVVVTQAAQRLVGVVVDSLSEVVSLTMAEIQLGGQPDSEHVAATAAHGGRSLVLLNLDRLLDGPDLDLIDELAG